MRIPPHRRPAGWGGISDPVCPLLRALYGHPNSGAYWEQRCDKKVLGSGFKRVGECGEWRSCYFHKELKVLLVIYVDDFKMAGPKSKVAQAWNLLRTGEGAIIMDDPSDVSHYIG